jgi:hypothetical protein
MVVNADSKRASGRGTNVQTIKLIIT